MKFTNADIGNLITALDEAILDCSCRIECHSPARGLVDRGIVKEAQEQVAIFKPLRARLRRHEKAQLKKHFPKGFPKGRRKS